MGLGIADRFFKVQVLKPQYKVHRILTETLLVRMFRWQFGSETPFSIANARIPNVLMEGKDSFRLCFAIVCLLKLDYRKQ